MNRLVIVKSCQKYRERQRACRKTWAGALLAADVELWFLEGGHGTTACEWALELATGDGYENNSQKLREGLRYLLKTSDFSDAFICDDDTFIHPERWLAHVPAGELECRLYYPRNDQDEKRNGGKPWILGGAGWWMTRRLCQRYVEKVSARCSWDDILAAQVAQRAGALIIDRPDLYGGDRYSGTVGRVGVENELITCHHVEPAEMFSLWEAIHVI